MPKSRLGLSEVWLAELRGPIHGRIQTLRGMCTDERSHAEIDAKLTELDELVYALSTAIEFPPSKPSRMNLTLVTGKSNCCGAPLTLGGTPDFPGQHYAATLYYVCLKCGEPCDPKPEDK